MRFGKATGHIDILDIGHIRPDLTLYLTDIVGMGHEAQQVNRFVQDAILLSAGGNRIVVTHGADIRCD